MPTPPPPKKQQVTGSDAARKANYTGGRPKDESKLSTDPRQVRIRLRRAARKGNKKADGRIQRDLEMLYKKPIDEWDVEELARGRPRNAAGDFRGKMPSWITPTIASEAKRRLLDNTFAQMSAHADLAINTVVKLMKDDMVDDKGKPITDSRTKLAAATFVIEHILGKPKAIVEVGAEDFTKQAIAAAIVLDDGKDQSHLTLEGEFTVDDEEEGDDDAEGE